MKIKSKYIKYYGTGWFNLVVLIIRELAVFDILIERSEFNHLRESSTIYICMIACDFAENYKTMDLQHHATPGKYVEYLIATQGSWPIYGN